ncbi:MAG: hypothetical protein WCQ21_10750 [Verrucomicrobiota bacterium]
MAAPRLRGVPDWIWVLGLILAVPALVLWLGFLPPDDGLRHCAKAVSGRPWSDVVLLRPGMTLDHNVGWHGFLGAVHWVTGWGPQGLLAFSILLSFATFNTVGFVVSRTTWGWLLALVGVSLLGGSFVTRLWLGRPFFVMLAVWLVLLKLWDAAPCRPRTLLITTSLIALSTWVHGAWYLFFFLVPPLLLVRGLGGAGRYFACCCVGSGVGVGLSGNGVERVELVVGIVTGVTKSVVVGRGEAPLVKEFLPMPHQAAWLIVVLLLGGVLLLRCAGKSFREVCWNLPFLTAMLALGVGLKVGRFWLDLGAPACCLWLAEGFRKGPMQLGIAKAKFALVLGWVCACPALICGGIDKSPLWDPATPPEYLPQPGSVVFNGNMGTFMRAYFENPWLNYRFAVGYEPTLSPPEIYRGIAPIWNKPDNPGSYEPWVALMQSNDLLTLRKDSVPPPVPGVAWRECGPHFWVGRRLQ